ncbi:MAG: site-2 protease family protein [Myxococcota bacterium]
MDSELIQRIALFMPALFLSLAVHEYAHAWTATRLGDATPGRQGRLTLSPLAHLDPLGSVLFPLLMLVMHPSFLFGWARPVQFNPANFDRRLHMRTGAAITAAAGPLSNVALALLSALALRFALQLGWASQLPGTGGRMLLEFLSGMFSLNVLLAIFNLFPLPPLDGHYLLPRSMDEITEWLRRYAFILFIAIFFLPLPGLGRSLGSFIIHPLMEALMGVLEAIAFYGT